MSSSWNRGSLSYWRRVSRRSRFATLLLIALLVPVGVVGMVGVASLRNQALAREHLLNETYRQVAEIVATRLDDRLAGLEAAVATELARLGADAPDETLIAAVRAAQASRPWLRPAVLVRADGTSIYPPSGVAVTPLPARGTSGAAVNFLRAFEAAEAAEMRERDLDAAVGLYADAVERAGDDADKSLALNGLARCLYKSGHYREAAATYQRLIAMASTSTPAQANLSVHARRQPRDAGRGGRFLRRRRSP